jgi:hypothetical protein
MRALATAVAASAIVVAVTVAAAPATEVTISVTVASPSGVGGLKIGRTIDRLQEMKLIGGARKGCELARGERVASLKAPLEGTAHFYPGRRLSSVAVTAGAVTPTGVEIGTPAGQARKAYPTATYDPPPPRAPIQAGFIWIGGRFDPKMTLVIDPDSHRVSEIAVPFPSICE